MSFTGEEWDEIKEGIPAKDDPFLMKYLQGREALIAQEKKTRSGVSYSASSRSTKILKNARLTKPSRCVLPQQPVPNRSQGM